MASTDIQSLLRFLTGPAKLPLREAMGKARPLLAEGLSSPVAISKASISQIQKIFTDEKIAKQVSAAAKRTSNASASGTSGTRKRSATEANTSNDAGDSKSSTSPSKRRKPGSNKVPEIDPSDPSTWELGLDLPVPNRDENLMTTASLTTNRAPLLLVFAIVSLGYTHPWMPISSRFSLAQGLLELTASVKAKSLGIPREGGGPDELEEGYKKFRVLGKEIPVLRRWDATASTVDTSTSEAETNTERLKQGVSTASNDVNAPETHRMNLGQSAASIGDTLSAGESSSFVQASRDEGVAETSKTSSSMHRLPTFGSHTDEPIYWALSPKLLSQPPPASKQNPAALPIQLPLAAHSYLVRSFSQEMLPLLLGALHLVYESWNDSLRPGELDQRGWVWYCRVRPSVEDGPGGWGGKGVVKLIDILKLKKAG